ncbi:hypothetical protein BDV18DRAFT_22584 [Aspergillus unguis]
MATKGRASSTTSHLANTQSEIPLNPGLGNFSRLPIEICQMIWGYINLPMAQVVLPDLTVTIPGVEPLRRIMAAAKQDRLSLLQTSKAINVELTAMTYQHARIEIEIRPELPPEERYVAHKKRTSLGISLRVLLPGIGLVQSGPFENVPDDVCKWLSLRRLPYERAKTTIVVYAPRPEPLGPKTHRFESPGMDRGAVGLVALWDRINKVVDMLSNVPSIREIELVLCPNVRENSICSWSIKSQNQGQDHGQTKDGGRNRISCGLSKLAWGHSGLVATMMPRPLVKVKVEPSRELYDHEAVFLPFCRLRNVQNMSISVARGAGVGETDDSLLALDWSFHQFALHYFFNNPSSDSSISSEANCAAQVEIDKIREVLYRFNVESNILYQFLLRDKFGDALSLLKSKTVGLWRPSPQLNDGNYMVEKYDKDVNWTWPDFIFQADGGTFLRLALADEKSKIESRKGKAPVYEAPEMKHLSENSIYNVDSFPLPSVIGRLASVSTSNWYIELLEGLVRDLGIKDVDEEDDELEQYNPRAQSLLAMQMEIEEPEAEAEDAIIASMTELMTGFDEMNESQSPGLWSFGEGEDY